MQSPIHRKKAYEDQQKQQKFIEYIVCYTWRNETQLNEEEDMATKLWCEKGLTNNNVNVSRCNYKCNRTMEFYGFHL